MLLSFQASSQGRIKYIWPGRAMIKPLGHVKFYGPTGPYLPLGGVYIRMSLQGHIPALGAYPLVWPYRAITTPGGYLSTPGGFYLSTPGGYIYPDALVFLTSRHQMSLYFLSTPDIRTNSIPGFKFSHNERSNKVIKLL